MRQPPSAIGTVILALLSSVASLALAAGRPAMSVSAYIAELDRLLLVTRQLADNPRRDLEFPPAWLVETDRRTFEVSTRSLQSDLDEWRAGGGDQAASMRR